MKLVAGLMVLAAAVAVIVAIGAVTRESGNDPSTGSAEIVMEDLRFTPNQLNAKVEFIPCMNQQELTAGIEKWMKTK